MTHNVRLTGGAAGAGGSHWSSRVQHVNFVFLAGVVTTVLSPTTLVPPRQSLHGAPGDFTGLDKIFFKKAQNGQDSKIWLCCRPMVAAQIIESVIEHIIESTIQTIVKSYWSVRVHI